MASQFAPPPEVYAVRAALAKRAGLQPTRQADAWRRSPTWLKQIALKRARLDPNRECMPLETFESRERTELAAALGAIERESLQLMKAVAS